MVSCICEQWYVRGADAAIALCAGTARNDGYNRVVRKFAVLLPLFWLAACQHDVPNNEAIRQGVVDFFSGPMGLNMQAMDVKLDTVDLKGDKAEAMVSVTLKGKSEPMSRRKYFLAQQDGKWVVTGREGSAAHGAVAPAAGAENPHGGGTVPGAENPHAGGKMPLPEDLPPAGKKR